VTDEVRSWLRGLPPFPDTLPVLDPAGVPERPVELFLQWMRDAADSGIPAPHSMTLSTMGEDGPSARVLILKDVSDSGWSFAKSSNSPTGRALSADARAAMTFFWPAHGRQVRVEGAVREEQDAVARADFLARPASSRVSTLVGRQSDVLHDAADYAAARAEAAARLEANPELVSNEWAVWVLQPTVIEFWQASADRAHARVLYRPTAEGWRRELLWP